MNILLVSADQDGPGDDPMNTGVANVISYGALGDTQRAIVPVTTVAGSPNCTIVTPIASTYIGANIVIAGAGAPGLQGATQTAAGTGAAPGDIITLAGGTFTTAAQITVLTTKVVSATIHSGGTGGTNGTASVWGTTGNGQTQNGVVVAAGVSGQLPAGAVPNFEANITISGGAATAVNSITAGGYYSTNPTNITQEPVIVAGDTYSGTVASFATLANCKLTVVMGVADFVVTNPGVYSVLPTSFTQGSTTGGGTGFTCNAPVWQGAPLQTTIAGVGSSNSVTLGTSALNTLSPVITVSGVTITGTGGQFAGTLSGFYVGMQLTIAGTITGGSITGYVNPTTYFVSATDGVSTFTLQTLAQVAIVTGAGATTGLTFTPVTVTTAWVCFGHDDAPGIQAALNSGAYKVIFPANMTFGQYSQISLPALSSRIIVDGQGSTLVALASLSSQLIQTSQVGKTFDFLTASCLRDLCLDGMGLASYNLTFYATQWTVTNMAYFNATVTNVVVGNGTAGENNVFSSSWCYNNPIVLQIYPNYLISVDYTDNHFTDILGQGALLGGVNVLTAASGIYLTNVHVYQVLGGHGLNLASGDAHVTAFQNDRTAPGKAGINIPGTGQSNVVTGWRCDIASGATHAQWGVLLGGASAGNVVTNGIAPNLALVAPSYVAWVPSGAIYANTVINNQGTNIPPVLASTQMANGFFGAGASIAGGVNSEGFIIEVGSSPGSAGCISFYPPAPIGWLGSSENNGNYTTNDTTVLGSAIDFVVIGNFVRTTGVAGDWTAGDNIYCSCRPS